MFHSIRKLFTYKLINKEKCLSLGRWAIKHEVDKCNEYMLKMHADPGYIHPYKKKSNKEE